MYDKIVFIDIDGTLFDNDLDLVHQSTFDVIKRLKENHIYIIIASGRSKVMGDEVFKRFNLEFDGYVLINGQYVLLQDEVIYKNPLSKQFIKKFINLCDNQNLPYGFVTEKDTFVSSHEDHVLAAFDNFKMNLPKIITNNNLKEDIYQGLFFNAEYINYFSQKFKQYVRFIPWLDTGADIIPREASKAVGMKKICEKLNISRENIYAIGDSNNDIEMIQYAKYGIAMGNAKPALKEVADYITADIKEDGLKKAFEKFNLI